MKEDHSRKEYLLVLSYFWPRLLATCLGWAANDFAFYGNKLFQVCYDTASTSSAIYAAPAIRGPDLPLHMHVVNKQPLKLHLWTVYLLPLASHAAEL